MKMNKMGAIPPKTRSSCSFPLAFHSLRSSSSSWLLPSAVFAGWRRERCSAPAACSSNSRGEDRRDAASEDMSPFGRGDAAAAADATGTRAAEDNSSALLLATKPVEQMTPREVMRLLPAQDQEHVIRIAKQGRVFGLFSAVAAGTWVYKVLRRRGSPLPTVGGAFIGLTLGYPLGITLTMAFHGKFLRKISHDLMETQKRARDKVDPNGSSLLGCDSRIAALAEGCLPLYDAAVDASEGVEYYSTFPATPPGEQLIGRQYWGDSAAAAEAATQQQQQEQRQPGWGGDSTELLDDTHAADAAAAAAAESEQKGGTTLTTASGTGSSSSSTSKKTSRIDGTGKGDEILKV